MRRCKIILKAGICLGCLLFFGIAWAEDPDFDIRLWQAEDGLPHNIVQAITQTTDGFLWVGTREGLARFDGERFQMVSLLRENLQPSVLHLLGSKNGSLWVGTEKSGLFHFHNGVVERCKLPDGNLDFGVFDIREGADGSIWIETSHEIFRRENGQMEQRAKFKYEQQPFCMDKAGQVWLFDAQLKRLDAKVATNYEVKSGSLPHAARSLLCDQDGVFWVGDSTGGLVELKDGVARKFNKADGPAGFISVIFRDNAENLWIGSYAGLSRFVNGEFINLRAPDEPSYRIYAIYEDHEQNLWVGSEEGLARLTPKRFKTITKKDGLTLNTVVTVCPSRDGSVWISCWGGGLNHWVNGKITSLSKSNGLSSDFIMAMTETSDGSLWAGSDYGAALNRIKNGQITRYGREQNFMGNSGSATTALFEDDAGTLWIGARESFQYWNGKEFSSVAGMNNKKINALCGGANGVMWIGMDDGLVQWRDGKFKNFASEPELRQSILSLYEDAEHTLWIGTRSHGLLRFQNNTLAAFTSAEGLFSDSIYSILEDNRGNLWLNSSRGIFRVKKTQLASVASGKNSTINSISYGKADGILMSGQYQEETQPAACKSTDGHLWFRTTQGVAVVDPEKITTNLRPPPVVIEQIIADKKMLEDSLLDSQPANKFVVQPGRGELEIHYAALSFSAPRKNQFRYKLDGVDLNWVDAGTRRVAFYNNLRPGKYRFQVTACNNDGVWNDIGAAVTLELKPHFWQTDWFLTAAVASLILIVGGIARYATRRRMQRRLEILKRQNAVEKERARIARDMHDELGAKLTRISFQGATARRRLSNPVEAEQQIEKMSETARDLVLSLDQIVWAVDPQNDTLESLAAYICRYTSDFVENSPLHCEFLIPTKLPDHRLSTETRHNIFLAVKEILNNAAKHSEAKRLVLKISAARDEFEISIADDGRGFVPAEVESSERFKRTGRGLANLRERLASIHGRFELRSKPGHGTEIRLIVPLQDESQMSSIHTTRGKLI